MTLFFKEMNGYTYDKMKIATEAVPEFVMGMLKSDWFDKLIAKCEAKANKKFNVDEIMFVVDYTISLLGEDVEDDYIEQTVEYSDFDFDTLPEGNPISLLTKCVDIKFSFSETTTAFLDRCEKCRGKKYNLPETLMVLNYAVGFKSGEVDIDDLLDAMSEADL